MSGLPPLANLFAAGHPDPARLHALADRLSRGGRFERVVRPAEGWVAAVDALPGGPDPAGLLAERGVGFAEGADRVAGPEGGAKEGRLRRFVEQADRAPEGLDRFAGDFGCLRFSPDGALTAVRSCGGLAPLYYLHEPGSWRAVGTRLGFLVRALPLEPSLDPLVAGVWTTGYDAFPDGRTFFEGVRIVPRGAFVTLRRGRRPRVASYWDPRPERLPVPSEEAAAEHARELRTLLVGKLERDLHPAGGNLLMLSGGADSSVLAALAGERAGRELWSWTLLPPRETECRRRREAVEAVQRRYGVARRWWVRAHATTRLRLIREAPDVCFPVIHPALGALPGLLEEAPVRVLLGGEGAEEICGSGSTVVDWALDTPLRTVLSGMGRGELGPRDGAQWAWHRLRHRLGRRALPLPDDLPALVRPEVREEYREWRGRLERRPAGPRGQLALSAVRDGYVAMNWEAATRLGVRRSFPFFHREVLELAHRCHPVELVKPGPKRILERAVPDEITMEGLFESDRVSYGLDGTGPRLPWARPLPDALGRVVRGDWCPRPPGRLRDVDAWRLTALLQLARAAGLDPDAARDGPDPGEGRATEARTRHGTRVRHEEGRPWTART